MTLTKRLIIIAVITVAAGLTLYRTALFSVISAVLHREGSSHGIFVPVLSLYFLWFQFDRLKTLPVKTHFNGLGLMVAGLILPVLGIGTYHVVFVGFLVFLAGLILLMLGKDLFNHVAFPVFFLAAMVPIPGRIYIPLADILRHISFGGSLVVLSVLDIPHFREGWYLQLPNVNLIVNTGCSGIRYLISYFVFGIAYAYITREPLKQRIMVVLSTIPLSLCASVMRLTMVFLLAHYISPWLAEHRPHVLISWINFVIFLFGAIALDQHFVNRKKGIRQDRPD